MLGQLQLPVKRDREGGLEAGGLKADLLCSVFHHRCMNHCRETLCRADKSSPLLRRFAEICLLTLPGGEKRKGQVLEVHDTT